MIDRAEQAMKKATDVTLCEKEAIGDAMKYIDMKYQYSVKKNDGYFVLEDTLIRPALKTRSEVCNYFESMGYKVFWVETVKYYIVVWDKEVEKEFKKRQKWFKFYINLSGYTISPSLKKILKVMVILIFLTIQVCLIESDVSTPTTGITGVTFFFLSLYILSEADTIQSL